MRAPVHKWGEVREKAAEWLMQGITPQRLALTLALGFVLGCIPLLGIPTGLCIVVALAFRLNQPAIQAANYAAMPFQVALIVPFTKLGGKLTPSFMHAQLDLVSLAHTPLSVVAHSSTQVLEQIGILAGQALLGWFLLAIPVALLLTLTLTRVFRRVPMIAAAESQN